MTTPRYPLACAAEFQEREDTSSSPVAGWPDNAWNVNFNNGNVNNWNRNNELFVRPVRGPVAAPGECQGAVSFQDMYRAWRSARRSKKPSANQLAFETDWISNIVEMVDELNTGTRAPRPTICFIAQRPKAREIHAPDFADRVVHHWLVPQLEAIYERSFIHDSYSNRIGKGTHAAVHRLRGFVRQVHSGQNGGWYLQLDVHNFFNSIHRPTLWAMLKPRLQRAGLSDTALRTTHALLRHAPLAAGVRYRASEAERAQVPPRKRLENAAPGCGLPIGNLSSQFFANVYLDALDQFVKHELRAQRYLRYVDDFVLVHHSRDQLEEWRQCIEQFLHERLRLKLKAEQKLRPLGTGIDFLGYVIHPTHTRVRRRVVAHLRESLHSWQQRHVHGAQLRGTPADYRHINSVLASFDGHLAHANAHRLRAQIEQTHPWIAAARMRRRFALEMEGQQVEVMA